MLELCWHIPDDGTFEFLLAVSIELNFEQIFKLNKSGQFTNFRLTWYERTDNFPELSFVWREKHAIDCIYMGFLPLVVDSNDSDIPCASRNETKQNQSINKMFSLLLNDLSQLYLCVQRNCSMCVYDIIVNKTPPTANQ